MSADTFEITRESLQPLSPNAIRKVARERFGMSMPFGWSKDQLIEQTVFQAAPSEPVDEEPEAPSPEAAIVANVPDRAVALTADDVQARLAMHRQRLAQEEADRATETTPRYAPWQPTQADLTKHAQKLTRAIAGLVWAQHRIAKEAKFLESIAGAMGELITPEMLSAVKRMMVLEYNKEHLRQRFPSPALSGAKIGETLQAGVWSELLATGAPNKIAQLLGDQEASDSDAFAALLSGDDDSDE